MHGVAGLVRQRVHVGKNVLLVIHQDVGRRAVTAGGKRAAAFASGFVAIAPALRAQTFCQSPRIFASQRGQRVEHHFRGLFECETGLDFRNKRHVGIVMMQLGQSQNAPPQIKITKERFQIGADGSNQPIVNGDWHIVRKQRRFQRRGVIARPGVEDIRFDRIGQSRRKRVLMIAELGIKLTKSAFAQRGIALHQKRAE